jgi:hypothetical protein
MSTSYNANLFELRVHEPLKVNTYFPEVEPRPARPAHFYKIMGRLAKKLTDSMEAAVISDEGRIKVLEATISESSTVNKIQLENLGDFTVKLKFEETHSVNFADEPIAYGRLINKIVDLSLCNLSDDYYKYSEFSPYIMERGEGYFDESLRKRIGVEDGRRFYRGVRVAFGIPHLLINREIELRSWKNLLNELKILAEWWQAIKKKPVDFYNPPKDYINFVNWAFRNRTANVKEYSAPSIIIDEITWAIRAKDKVLEGNISPCEYHKIAQGIPVKDENQPLIKWKLETKEGTIKTQFHIPEFLVVGHTFKDIRMRISDSQTSQVFDILHPHCGDQQRKIFDLVRKIDCNLRNRFKTVYPAKLEFEVFPKDVRKIIEPPSAINIKFGNKEVKLLPPYGINFYKKYTAKEVFAKPIGTIKMLAVCDEQYTSFVEHLSREIENRNQCTLSVDILNTVDVEKHDFSGYNLVLTITKDEKTIRQYKEKIVSNIGLAHQNLTPEKANTDSIPQLVMQITLKLGGYPWLLANPYDANILSIYAYRNPFNGTKNFLYSLMSPEGELIYQSKPFEYENFQNLLNEMKPKIPHNNKLIAIMSFSDLQIQDQIVDALKDTSEFFFIKILQRDELRLFSTFKPLLASPSSRRRTVIAYPLESYENAPQGVIMQTAPDEYYILTTGSTKVGTYYRGCPNPIRVKILMAKGIFEANKIMHTVLSMSLEAGTSGNGTRLPASLYYLKKYAKYVNEYGFPSNQDVLQRIFYV